MHLIPWSSLQSWKVVDIYYGSILQMRKLKLRDVHEITYRSTAKACDSNPDLLEPVLALISHVSLGGHTDGFPGDIPGITLLIVF